MKDKVLIREIHQKRYQPIVWVKDDSHPKGKRQLELWLCNTKEEAQTAVDIESAKNNVFFTDIKENVITLEGEFYIQRGYYS